MLKKNNELSREYWGVVVLILVLGKTIVYKMYSGFPSCCNISVKDYDKKVPILYWRVLCSSVLE